MKGLLCLVFISLARTSQQGQLLRLMPDVDEAEVKECRKETISSCTVVMINTTVFEDGELIFPNGEVFTKSGILQEPKTRPGILDQALSIVYENNDESEAIFSIRSGMVYGSLDGRNIIQPCSLFAGCHLYRGYEEKEDEKDRDCINESVEQNLIDRTIVYSANQYKLREKGILDNTTMVEFSVKFYYTQAFGREVAEKELFFDNAVAEANKAYQNSKIPLRMTIFCIEPIDIKDENSLSAIHDEFTNFYKSGSNKKDFATLRGGADATVLYTYNKDYNKCGTGGLGGWRYGSTTVAIQLGCLSKQYVLAHEVGHNFGCQHEEGNGDDNVNGFEYGHGTFIEGTGRRTIMCHSKPGYRSKANFFSGPQLSYQGVPTGGAFYDNARVIRENRFAMAAIADEVGTCNSIPVGHN